MEYGNKECNFKYGENLSVVVCDVIINDTCVGDSSMRIPTKELSSKIDTSTDNRSNVYVKYYDDEFYPKFIVDYTCPFERRSHYQRKRKRFDYDDEIDW